MLSKQSREKAPKDATYCERQVSRELGVDTFARSMKVSSDHAILTIAAILGGIAGPNSCFPNRWDASALPTMHLLTPSDGRDETELLDCLTAPLSRLQKRLAQNMARYRPEAVDVLLKGYDPLSIAKNANKAGSDKTLQHVHAALVQGGVFDSRPLDSDLTFDPVVQRAEAMKHPRMVLSKIQVHNLPNLLAECHLRHALVVTPVLRERDLQALAARATRKANEFKSLLEGSLGYCSEDDRTSDLPMGAWMILKVDAGEAAKVAEGDLAGQFIWAVGGDGAAAKMSKIDHSSFFENYQQSVERLIELRRSGKSPMISFESLQSAQEFGFRLEEYQSRGGDGAIEGGDPTWNLPKNLFWTLQFLRESMERPEALTDSALIALTFGAAKRLRASHRKLLLAFRGKSLVEEQLQLAREVARRLERWQDEGKAPPTAREISRWFSRQKKDRFDPVLDALLKVGVIKVDKGKVKRFTLGEVEVETIGEKLSGIFS